MEETKMIEEPTVEGGLEDFLSANYPDIVSQLKQYGFSIEKLESFFMTKVLPKLKTNEYLKDILQRFEDIQGDEEHPFKSEEFYNKIVQLLNDTLGESKESLKVLEDFITAEFSNAKGGVFNPKIIKKLTKLMKGNLFKNLNFEGLGEKVKQLFTEYPALQKEFETLKLLNGDNQKVVEDIKDLVLELTNDFKAEFFTQNAAVMELMMKSGLNALGIKQKPKKRDTVKDKKKQRGKYRREYMKQQKKKRKSRK